MMLLSQMEDDQKNEKKLKNKYIPTVEFYSQIIDSLQDYSIFTLDNNFIINSWSSGSVKIFGYETTDVIGEHFNIIFTDEDVKNGIPQKEIQIALKEGRATDNRWHITKDKSTFYAYGLVFPLTGLDGEMLGYVKILRDLTDRKKSEDAIKKYMKDLEELNTHKENVLAILSHDLRSPLASIIGTTKYLKNNFHKTQANTQLEMLELIHKASTDQLEMLDYLLEWARVKYASEVFTPAKIKLLKYVEDVFEKLSDSASLNAINLKHEIKENTFVFADGKMVFSIFQNLVSNAIKHTGTGGTITITSKIDGDKQVVEIQDTGIGMSKEVQSKLFSPQIKVLSEKRATDKGAGIGLLLVKGFLETCGGEIWVKSTEGEGSTFYFTLPIEKPVNKVGDSDELMFDESA